MGCSDDRKREWGCFAREVMTASGPDWVEKAAIPWVFNGEYDYQCPRRPWLEDPVTMVSLYDAYNHYRNGFLPEDGGVVNQPVKLMRALAVMSDQVVMCQDEKRAADRQREEHRRRAEQVAQSRPGGSPR